MSTPRFNPGADLYTSNSAGSIRFTPGGTAGTRTELIFAQTADVTINMPDTAGATASLILSEGAQTINGATTFTANILGSIDSAGGTVNVGTQTASQVNIGTGTVNIGRYGVTSTTSTNCPVGMITQIYSNGSNLASKPIGSYSFTILSMTGGGHSYAASVTGTLNIFNYQGNSLAQQTISTIVFAASFINGVFNVTTLTNNTQGSITTSINNNNNTIEGTIYSGSEPPYWVWDCAMNVIVSQNPLTLATFGGDTTINATTTITYP